jgi:hypothetical protein
MGLDVWFQEDVARALRAAYVAGREAHLGVSDGGRPALLSREMAAYWRGYQAALATIGTAFGLTSPIVDPLVEADSSPHLTGTASQLRTNGLARPWDLDAAGEGE